MHWVELVFTNNLTCFSNMIGGMIDSMMGNIESEGTMMGSGNSIMSEMEKSPSMGSQMRPSDNLMGNLFG